MICLRLQGVLMNRTIHADCTCKFLRSVQLFSSFRLKLVVVTVSKHIGTKGLIILW
jgi:hypothetical protein